MGIGLDKRDCINQNRPHSRRSKFRFPLGKTAMERPNKKSLCERIMPFSKGDAISGNLIITFFSRYPFCTSPAFIGGAAAHLFITL
jgi:hypothetical protein